MLYESTHQSGPFTDISTRSNCFPEYHDLTKVMAARLLTNLTFMLWRIFIWKFLIIFCYMEGLFPRHSESNRTRIFLEQALQSVQKLFFQKYSGKSFQEDKCSSPKSKQYFRKKMYVMELVLFSVMLRASSASSVLSSIAWSSGKQSYPGHFSKSQR